MKTADIRQRFLTFFAERDHTIVPSASLVYNDPTLLFVNAGMVPFKPYFTGAETAPFKRAVSVQKCVRTLDIEEVGKTTRHGTFFQMNGNFSFGDYFKEGAIEYAWELVTGSQADGNYGFDPDKVWVTVYLDDDEGAALWRKVGVPDARIQRRGLKDNYWHMGIPGPGGPCSEIYIDRGPEFGADGGPIVDEDRFLEIWNLVFQTEELSAVRAKDDFDVARPLPSQNIDTGMGLERTAYLLQGVANMYEIDEIFPVITRAAELAGRPYGTDAQSDIRLRVVGDPWQRGPRLRAAPAAPPQHPLHAVAGRQRPGAARTAARQPRPDGRLLPGRRRPVGAGQPGRVRRGGSVPAHPGGRHADLRPGGGGGARGAQHRDLG
jgi:alanyl-tRNA synthetase